MISEDRDLFFKNDSIYTLIIESFFLWFLMFQMNHLNDGFYYKVFLTALSIRVVYGIFSVVSSIINRTYYTYRTSKIKVYIFSIMSITFYTIAFQFIGMDINFNDNWLGLVNEIVIDSFKYLFLGLYFLYAILRGGFRMIENAKSIIVPIEMSEMLKKYFSRKALYELSSIYENNYSLNVKNKTIKYVPLNKEISFETAKNYMDKNKKTISMLDIQDFVNMSEIE